MLGSGAHAAVYTAVPVYCTSMLRYVFAAVGGGHQSVRWRNSEKPVMDALQCRPYTLDGVYPPHPQTLTFVRGITYAIVSEGQNETIVHLCPNTAVVHTPILSSVVGVYFPCVSSYLVSANGCPIKSPLRLLLYSWHILGVAVRRNPRYGMILDYTLYLYV